MAMGFLASLVTIPKFLALHELQGDQDFSYQIALFTMWLAVEAMLAIICVSLPALKNMFETCLRTRGIIRSTSNGSEVRMSTVRGSVVSRRTTIEEISFSRKTSDGKTQKTRTDSEASQSIEV
jgi:hypothetical protein